jgi:hypothetical protein
MKKSNDIIMHNQIFLWLAVATGLILLIPLAAMQFTTEVNWDSTDFIVMGTLLFGSGSIFVFTARKVQDTTRRVVLGVVVLAAVLYLWAELAVGIFTHWGS